MATGSQRWIVRDVQGHIHGPYFTKDILKKISVGEFSGEEDISPFPGSDWHPISQDPQFYDKLLEVLEREGQFEEEEHTKNFEGVETAFQKKPKESPLTKQDLFDEQEGFIFSKNPQTKKEDSSKKKRSKKVSKAQKIGPDGKPISEEPQKNKKEEKAERAEKAEEEEKNNTGVIELKKKDKAISQAKSKKMILPLFVVFAVIMVAIFVLLDGGAKAGSIRFLVPKPGSKPLSKEVISQKLKQVQGQLAKDTMDGYLAAHNGLIQIIEGAPKINSTYSLLCLTYLELWPYSLQDSKNIDAIGRVNQYVSKLAPGGQDSNACRAIDSILNNQMDHARGLIEATLDSFVAGERPPVLFFYLKAKVLEDAGNFSSAITYLNSGQQLWPQWLKLYVYEGILKYQLKQYNSAAQRFAQVLKVNSHHQVARVYLGIIEHRQLKNYEKGEALLKSALENPLNLPGTVASEGYQSLALISYEKGNEQASLDYAKLSYKLNPGNEKAREIVLKLGGKDQLSKINVEASRLIFEGDQLVKEGDCSAASAVYKAAFNTNKKSGLAALKAAKCLWKVSLTSEAIEWLNKAIVADRFLIDAYITLSDYYLQRFDFSSASKVLARAKETMPKNYKVYQGYAKAELKRNNPKGAITYANYALKLYGGDVESMVILAEANLLLQSAEAYTYANKAIELDVNNRKAQAVYAKALVGARGVGSAIDYASELSNSYPMAIEYRIALAELYMQDDRYSAAEEILLQLTLVDEKIKGLWVKLGLAQKAQSKFKEAASSFLKGTVVDPSDARPLFESGQLYLSLNKPVDARTQFQRVLRINKNYPRVHFFLGKAALMMSLPQEALEQAQLERGKNPNLADSYLLAAEAYMKMDQYRACAGEYQRAIKLRKQGATLYIKLAICNRLAGNLDAAVDILATAAELESGNPEVYREQGLVYETKGFVDKAVYAYKQYLVLAPNAPDSARVRQKIQSLE